MAKNQKAKKQSKKDVKERIPEGMRREDYADAAFKKKVTIIMGSILLVFIIGVSVILVGGWADTQKHNKAFEEQQQRFKEEKENIIKELEAIDAAGESAENRAKVKIKVTDENFYDWVLALDSSYNVPKDDDGYAVFDGATVELEGLFLKRVYKGGTVEYLVYRLHQHDDEVHNHGEDSHEHEESTDVSTADMVPIEVIFLDEDAEIPEDGAWVKVTGVVGNGSIATNYSAIHNAEVTVIEEPGNKYIE